MMTGVLARGTLIKSIYKRGVNLTGRARTKITNADLVNHISTDVGFLLAVTSLHFIYHGSRLVELMHVHSGL